MVPTTSPGRPGADRSARVPGTLAILGMFFLSGMGALVFENVWFNQAGLTVGNSVWAAALVVGAFMGGLALGNLLAGRIAARGGDLIAAYARAELVAGVSGIALVLLFPLLPGLLRPLFEPLMEHPAALNAVRALLAFVLMALPAAALGTTLPLLAKPLAELSGHYGVALGRLYGINTLGALAGTLLAELLLVRLLGLRGAGLVAGGCNLLAALLALRLAHHLRPAAAAPVAAGPRPRTDAQARRLLGAAFLAGGVFLALEVIWFRFLLLYLYGTSLTFAIMLAVVLAGIGGGGMLASRLLARGWTGASLARASLGLAAPAIVLGPALYPALWPWFSQQASNTAVAVAAATWLMGPSSLMSGVLFTGLGAELRTRLDDAAAATSALALANTLGGMLGSLLGAFLLLPLFGVETSFALLAAAYVAALLLVAAPAGSLLRRGWPLAAGLLALALFPAGQLHRAQQERLEGLYGGRLVAVREGMSESAYYLREDFLGEPLDFRLVTNSIPMSSTSIRAQRYMRLFAYLPAALHGRVENALLICFGVGTTARALLELPELRTLDIVDVSPDVLELNRLTTPPLPLADPRVRTHIEDGRFHLQQNERRYDLITGEPPPPNVAGMAALYSREYFQLMRARLNPGGLATYWLPFRQLPERDAYAVVAAFCGAFDDCTLWSGIDHEWILMGSAGDLAPVARDSFERLWRHAPTRAGLQRIGIETPSLLLAQFIADAPQLRAAAAASQPVVDNYPQRISSDVPVWSVEQLFPEIARPERSRQALADSSWAARLLPPELRAQALDQFGQRALADMAQLPVLRTPADSVWEQVDAVLQQTRQVELARWLLGSEARKIEIAARVPGHPLAAEQALVDALSRRLAPDPEPVERSSFDRATASMQRLLVFRACLSGDREGARRLASWRSPSTEVTDVHLQLWLDRRCPG